MNVSLTDKLEEFVNQLVESGRYRSANEVVPEGLRLLEIRESQLQGASENNHVCSKNKKRV